jgi:hypothetical protein
VAVRIGLNLEFGKCSMEQTNGFAINAFQLSVTGSVRANSPISCIGQCRFDGATIGSDLNFSGCTFLNGKDHSFSAQNAIINADLKLNEIHSEGMAIRNIKVGGDLQLKKARLDNDNKGTALHATAISVKGSLLWQEMSSPPTGIVDLTNAIAGQLDDDFNSWPIAKKREDKRLIMENFVYGTYCNTLMNVRQRLKWLQSQKTFSPQPYEQAAKVFRQIGRESDARKIARAKQNDLRRLGSLSPGRWCWNFFLNATIGHGYQVWRMLIMAIIIWGVGAVIFNHAMQCKDLMLLRPQDKHPEFSPVMYSIDVFLPIVDLRQKNYWIPDTAANHHNWVMVYFWIHIFLGWLLTTLSIVGLTGIVKKD